MQARPGQIFEYSRAHTPSNSGGILVAGWLLIFAVLVGLPASLRTADSNDTDPMHILASRHLHPHYGVLTSTLQRGSGELGMMWTPFQIERANIETGADFRLEIGLGAIKGKVGFVEYANAAGHSSLPFSLGINGAMLWTEWNPVGVARHQRFLGVAMDWCFMGIRLQFEGYSRISRADSREHGLFVFSAGIGF